MSATRGSIPRRADLSYETGEFAVDGAVVEIRVGHGQLGGRGLAEAMFHLPKGETVAYSPFGAVEGKTLSIASRWVSR